MLAAAGFAFSAMAGSVVLLDGAAHEGTVSFDGTGILVRGAGSVKVELRTVLSARFADGVAEEFQPGIVLTDGTQIAGAFTTLSSDTVTVRGMRIVAADVAWAVFQPFAAALGADVPPGKMGALLKGGDFFEGAVKSCDAQSARIVNPEFGPRTFQATEKDFLAIILRPFKAQPSAYEVVTKDGSRFPALDVIARDATGVILRHPRYDGLKIAMADLVEIRVHPTRYLALTSLKPARITGGDNAMTPAKSARGLEFRAGSTVTWELQTGGGTFVARISPSAEAAGTEKLIFTVFADANAVFRSNPLAPGTPPQTVRVVLPQAATVTLRVEGTEGSGVWSDPVVLRR